jgi:hypothetical protein
MIMLIEFRITFHVIAWLSLLQITITGSAPYQGVEEIASAAHLITGFMEERPKVAQGAALACCWQIIIYLFNPGAKLSYREDLDHLIVLRDLVFNSRLSRQSIPRMLRAVEQVYAEHSNAIARRVR